DTAFRGGPLTVVGKPSQGTGSTPPPPIAVPLTYTGVGAGADSVVITVQPGSVITGDTVVFQAIAYDNNAPVPGTPIGSGALDTARVKIPVAAQGKVVGKAQRGNGRVIAQLLTGPADTGFVYVQLAPSAIAVNAGNGQSAVVAKPLAQPIVARVAASDGIGV